MANNENLIPMNKRSTSEQREIAKKGGQKSGQVRKERAEMQKQLCAWLNTKHQDKDSNAVLTGNQSIISRIIANALNPESKYWAKSIDIILKMTGATLTDEELERQQAEIKLINARADMLSQTDDTALEKLDEILAEIENKAINS